MDEIKSDLTSDLDKKYPTLQGKGFAVVYNELEESIKDYCLFGNLITDYGDEFYSKKATGTSINSATGMRLGTGSTAVAKSGAGAAIVTYITASSVALDSSPASTNKGAGLGWRVTYLTTWPAGTATNSAITEVVITNENPLTNVSGAVGNTLSRAIISVNKGASDSLLVTWYHDQLGA